MRSVPPFEADLLVVLQGFVGHSPKTQALSKLVTARPRPTCLSRAGVELIQARLAKGCVAQLVRRGGWWNRRHLVGEQVKAGPIWERHAGGELALAFSGQALEFLIWCTAADVLDRESQPRNWNPAQLTIADRLLLWLAYETVRRTEIATAWAARPGWNDHALLRLLYPHDFSAHAALPECDFKPWFRGLGAVALEALQPVLAQAWWDLEHDKLSQERPQVLLAMAARQQEVLQALLAEAERCGRFDLVRWLWQLVGRLCDVGRPPNWATPRSFGNVIRLGERQALRQALLVCVAQTATLSRWEQQARAVGYWDEGYAASQLFKADWEELGVATWLPRARGLLEQTAWQS